MWKKFSKREKMIGAIYIVLSAFIFALGYQISFINSVWGRPEENYVNGFGIKSVLTFLLALFVSSAILFIVYFIHSFYQTKCTPDENTAKGNRNPGKKQKKESFIESGKKHKTFRNIVFIVLLVAWLPYFLAYLPGGVFSDTFLNISQAFAMDADGMHAFNNHHPILYILLWRFALIVGRTFHMELYGSIVMFLSLQYLFMVFTLSYLLYWLYVHGLNRKVSYILLAFVAVFPLFPLYAISLWKDTIFCLFLILFILSVGEYALEADRKLLNSTAYVFRMVLLGLLVCFFRNNGKYIVFATIIVMLVMNRKRLQQIKKFLISAVAMMLFVQIIQGPIYDHMGYNVDSTVESLGVPLQQIAYLVYYDYDMSEEETSYVNEICPIQVWKDHYNPCLFDAIKWYAPEFNASVIDQDKGKFIKNYFHLVCRHPVACTKAYMLATAGFWAPNIASFDGYVQNGVWNNDYGIVEHDFMKEHFGFTIRTLVSKMKPISSAIFLFIMLYAFVLLLMNRDYHKLLFLLPAFLNWATIMLATPLACSLRYVYILVLMLPIDIYLICISQKKDKITE